MDIIQTVSGVRYDTANSELLAATNTERLYRQKGSLGLYFVLQLTDKAHVKIIPKTKDEAKRWSHDNLPLIIHNVLFKSEVKQ